MRQAVQREGPVTTVDGAVSPEGDPDFFEFDGLDDAQDVYLELASDDPFAIGLGLFDASGTLVDESVNELPQRLEDLVPTDGAIFAAVCGTTPQGALDCSGTGLGTSGYTLTLPEPDASLVSWAVLAALAGLARWRARRGRRD